MNNIFLKFFIKKYINNKYNINKIKKFTKRIINYKIDQSGVRTLKMPSGHSGQVVQYARAAHRHLSYNFNFELYYNYKKFAIIKINILG
jgi:hypothetical protein